MVDQAEEFGKAVSLLRRYRTTCISAGLDYPFLHASVAAAALDHKAAALAQLPPGQRKQVLHQLKRAHGAFCRTLTDLRDEAARRGLHLPLLGFIEERANAVLELASDERQPAASSAVACVG